MIPTVEDQFQIHGPNGGHWCHVTSPAQSSVAAASFTRVFRLETARALIAELILAVAYIHDSGFVHGDIHLGNALIRLPSCLNQLSVDQIYQKFGEPYAEPIVRIDGQPLSTAVPSHGILPVWLGKKANDIPLAEAHLILNDFGEAFSPSASQIKRGGECCAPLPVLPPEARYEPEKPFSFPVDTWTLACAIWSILGPRPLFDGTLATHDDISAQQIDILGPLPTEWWNKWEARHEYFDEKREPKEGRFVRPPLEDRFEDDIQARRRRDGKGEYDREEKAAILAMLRPMLAFRPEEWASAAAVLGSEWMVKWGLLQFEKVPKMRGKRPACLAI